MKWSDIKHHPIVALIADLLVVYALFTLCRLLFLIMNWGLYADTLTWGHALNLFGAGIIFDTTAILYTNAIIILALLLPLHWKERKGYYRVVRWIYVVINSIVIWANLADCVYFPFTGKRTTAGVFQEFSHEGVGGMAKIMGEQFLSNWYLVVLGFAISWLLWRVFLPSGEWRVESVECRVNSVEFATAKVGSPAGNSTLSTQHSTLGSPAGNSTLFTLHSTLLSYYVTMTLALLLTIPLCIGGMRGGFTAAVRPITISNANQYVNQPSETGIVLNTPFAIYRTLGKKQMVVPDYMSDEEASALFTPIHQPADSVKFEAKNVVVFILESFGKQHFGFYNQTLRGGQYKGYTPFLDSLITHGAMTWQYSYANGRRSIEGMPSVLSSLPNYVEPLFLTPASLNHMSGLARELGEQKGYETAFFHGAQNGSMGFEAFARATGFGRYYGRTEYNEDKRFNGDDDFDGTWAIWDEEFLQYYALTMSEMRQPFMTAVFTASSHTPCVLPEKYQGKFPKGEDVVMECVAYSDHALRQFFATARKQPWFNNTLFVITADHTSGATDPCYKTSLGNYAVPIILYAPGDTTLCGYDCEKVVEQVDIMPTVLDYLHYDHPYLAFGKDMLATPADESHALHWVASANGYEYVSGPYVYEFDGEKMTAAYRYRTDSLLRQNVLASVPKDTLQQATRRMQSVIQQYMQRMVGDELVIKAAKEKKKK